jgi:hypothetical protein
MSSIEASAEGRALLAKLKSLLKDYAECMEAWDFIRELLQGQNLRHCHAWGAMDKPLPDGEGEEIETARAVITTDKVLLDFTFNDMKRHYRLTRLSQIAGIEESRYTVTGSDKPVPAIRAKIHIRDVGESSLYNIRGTEDTEEFRGFLRGLRQQLLKL